MNNDAGGGASEYLQASSSGSQEVSVASDAVIYSIPLEPAPTLAAAAIQRILGTRSPAMLQTVLSLVVTKVLARWLPMLPFIPYLPSQPPAYTTARPLIIIIECLA